jgi:hypothetical protein
MSAVPGTGTDILALDATFRLSTTATRFKRRILDTAFRYSFNLILTSLWSQPPHWLLSPFGFAKGDYGGSEGC